MRRREVPRAQFSHEEPPATLLRYERDLRGPRTSESFTQFLEDRAEWRRTHAELLPGLGALDRSAMWNLVSVQALVDAEQNAPRKPPEWVERAEAKRFGRRGGTGPLPEVVHPVDGLGDRGQGAAE